MTFLKRKVMNKTNQCKITYTNPIAGPIRHTKNSRTALALIFCLCLASCSEEAVRTESAYVDVAYEAHATGDSRLALFELATAIRNYPKNAELQFIRGKIFLDIEDGAAAEIAFNKAISLGYNKEFLKHNLAESWLYQRKPGKIIDTLEDNLIQGSKNALLYEIVGRAYIAKRDRTNPTLFIADMNKAEIYINEAYRLSPQNTRVLITKAWLTALSGKLDEALGWLDTADSIVKDQRQNLAVKGELLIRQDKLDEANTTYTRLTEKYPQYPQYKLELGYTHLLKNEWKTARKWIAPIVQQYPNHIRANNLLANISLMEKKYDEAKDLSEKVLTASPNDLPATLINGASSYFLGDLENAHQKLSNLYNKTGSIPALKLLASTKLKLGESQAAAKLLENAGQSITSQTDNELLSLVAAASAQIGKVDVALKAYQKLAEQSPNSSTFQKNAALLQISQGNYAEGFTALEEALKKENIKKEPGQDLYTLANKALQVRQLDRAKGYIDRYKAEAPKSYKPWTMSAVLNSILKNTHAVRSDFEQAMEIAPNVAEVKSRYAIFEKMTGNLQKAERLARQGLEIDPSDTGSGKLILEGLIRKKKFDEVTSLVEKAVNHANASPVSKLLFADYFTLLGRPNDTLSILDDLPATLKTAASYNLIASKAYLRSGQIQKAVDLLEKLTIENPNNIPAMKYLLRGYLLTKDQAKYQTTLEKLDRLLPNDYPNQIELAKLYISTGKYDKADTVLAIIKTDSQDQKLAVNLLKASLETNRTDYKAALKILTSLKNDYPQNGGITMLYARNLANDNQLSSAISVTKNWADGHPDNAEVKQFLGDLYLRQGDQGNALRVYQELLDLTSKLSPKLQLHAHNNLANIFIAEDQSDKAMMHAQKAFDLAPNNPAIVDTYAQALMKSGQPEKAVDHFNQALALLPTTDKDNRSLFTLGKAKALIQTGQKEQARNILNRVVKSNPGFSQIDKVKALLSDL